MGKQGPCCHCGVTNTPLWRNGPPEKPVLCNACGSRWRTKGTLANYAPLHARADPDDYEDHTVSKVKSISINKNKDVKLLQRKVNSDNEAVGGVVYDYSQGYRKFLDEDASNRSSSGSAISNSESNAQFGYAVASDLTGPAQSVVWDSTVPSKKRTSVNRLKPSPVEKLTKDLYTILHEQQSSCFSVSSEEDLLFESETPMVSVEIGHGSVLIRHPSSIARDEDSEASSLSVENKQYSINESYSCCASQLVRNENKNVENTKNPMGKIMQLEQLKRDKPCHERILVLGNHNSPLCNVDLNDIINFEEFARYLTNEEQQELLKYLPLVDTAELPDSIKSMFDSHQFKENISCYQQLLSEGVFDLSLLGAKTEDSSTLKKLTLTSLSKSKWVEHYHQLKKYRNSNERPFVGRGPVVLSCNSAIPKRSRDIPSQTNIEIKTTKSPKRISMKAAYETKEVTDNDGTCFSPRRLFALPSDGGSLMLDSLHSVDANPDQDLLLDVPSNGSFIQAELFPPALSFKAAGSH